MKSLEIDKVAATVTVGAGVKIGDVTGPIEDAGYELRKSCSL